MIELPERLEKRLPPPDPDLKLQAAAVAKVFAEDTRPHLTRKQVQNRLDGDYSKGTVLSRLEDLSNAEVLRGDPHADIWWLENDKSDWPIPPDVDVKEAADEPTVSEFFSLTAVRDAAIGVGLVLLASVFVWGGAFMAAGDVVFDLMVIRATPTGVIAFGFILTLFGWAAFLYGVFAYLREGHPSGS